MIVTRRVPLLEHELLTLPEHLNSPPVFNGVRVTCMICRSSFVLLCFVFWPMCCLFFFDIRILQALPTTSFSKLYIFLTTVPFPGACRGANGTQ